MKRSGVILKGMAFILSIAIAAILLGGRTLSAFSETDVEKVKTTGSCEGCNLRHANLSGANLSGVDLSRAKLGDAVLTDADLTDADLTGASLAGAYMVRADFSRARWVDGKTCGTGSLGRCEK